MYEDAGDGYDYENGGFAIVRLTWIEKGQEFLIGERAGSFPTLVTEREFRIVVIGEAEEILNTIIYNGEAVRWNVPQTKREING